MTIAKAKTESKVGSHDNKLDLNVGYSPTWEDLDMVDTEYVLPSAVDLSKNIVNIMHLNVRGLINKQDSLLRLLTTLGGKNKSEYCVSQ